MRCLGLVAGTGSIGRAFERIGWDVVSLDIDPKCEPTHVADIRFWDCRVYPHDHFDFVWASPCCTQFSVARTTGPPRDLQGADSLVSRALEIIAYFGCNWALENPLTGLLKTRDIVKGLPFFDTTYCRYDFEYRKATRIWTNLTLSLPPPCSVQNPCSALIGRRHPKTAQQSRRGSDPSDINNRCSQRELYSIPSGLCTMVAEAANRAVVQNEDAERGEGADASAAANPFVPEEL